MRHATRFEMVFNCIYQLLKSKPLAFYFSRCPQELANALIEEWTHEQNNNPVLHMDDSPGLCQKLVCCIRQVKQNNQLILLETPVKSITRTEEILQMLKSNYPGAFNGKNRRTKTRQGKMQSIIHFPENTPL